jgi:HSP20 family protein
MSESETRNAQGKDSEPQTNQPQSASRSGQPQNAAQSGAMQSRGQGRQGRGMARRGAYSPTVFLLNPAEIFTASPFELMRRFSEQMDRVFEGFGLSDASRSQGDGSQMATWTPAIEVFQRDNNLVVRAELPGVNKDDVKVEVTDDGLVIQGERREEHEQRNEGFYRREISYGRFYRVIPLPEDIDTEQVRAEFNNGVLEVAVPIPQAQQRRREIPIGAEGGEQARAASAKPAQS